LVRARIGSRWTNRYSLGVWASTTATVQRRSVSGRSDSDASVDVDTLVIDKKVAADGIQLMLRLFSVNHADSPIARNVGPTYSTAPPKKATPSAGNPSMQNVTLPVPDCSQMVYPDGGKVSCSPTSISMVFGYWGLDARPREMRARAAVAGVYNWLYHGDGNWPFNTACAATRDMEAHVARFTGFEQIGPWISAGEPVIVSYR
jgi:hypothetical protein